jgi:hypothetical protein
VYSNPRNNTGAFFEAFHKFRNVWRHKPIDARTVEGTDKAVYDKIVAQHGADSDQARVEVYGQFPNAGDDQLIPMDSIYGARDRELIPDRGAPLVMAVDYGNGGKDPSVIRFRQGLDGRSIPPIRVAGKEVLAFTDDHVIPAIEKYNPDGVVVDANGVGAAGGEHLKRLGYVVHKAFMQGKPADRNQYFNKRIECWNQMADWLRTGAIDDSTYLIEDLKGPKRLIDKATGKLRLESKDDMKARGLDSPNDGDALAMTFAVPVARKDLRASAGRRQAVATGMDYDVLSA